MIQKEAYLTNSAQIQDIFCELHAMEPPDDILHEPLKRYWYMYVQNHHEFKEPMYVHKCCFLSRLRIHLNLPEPRFEK